MEMILAIQNNVTREFFKNPLAKENVRKGKRISTSQGTSGFATIKERFGWRILNNPDSFWVRLLKTLYFPKGDFLSATKERRPSWIWSSLIDRRSALDLGCVRVIGIGKETNIFADPWIPSLPGFRLPHTVADFQMSTEGLMDQDSRSWNETTIRSFCSPSVSEAILRVPIGPADLDDF
ncbi:hypothetical protein LINPERPRIM_LOCUS40690 [Linum perenne]